MRYTSHHCKWRGKRLLSTMSSLPRVYLAGPDVFFPNAAAHFDALCALAASHGLQGLVPVDGGPHEPGLLPAMRAKRIFEGNVALIRSADAMLVNLQCFRGPESDSGTVWELGFAQGLGMPTAAYFPDERDYIEKVRSHMPVRTEANGRSEDEAGCFVEDLGLPANLMLVFGGPCFHTADRALASLARRLRVG